MLDWTEDAAMAAGCECALLAGGESGSSGDTADAVVRPGDARVFRLLQGPSARLACSPKCGRMSVSAIGTDDKWVLGDGQPSSSISLPFGFAWDEGGGDGEGEGGGGGGGSAPLVHALALQRAEQPPTTTAATATTTMLPEQQRQSPLLPRCAAALLFLGLNAAAASLASR